MDENERLLWLLGRFLNGEPVIPAAWVAQLADGGVSQEEAFALLLGSLLGLDAMGADRAFYARFLRPSVRQLDSAAYENDPFLLSIRVRHKKAAGNFVKGAMRLLKRFPAAISLPKATAVSCRKLAFSPADFLIPLRWRAGASG